MFHLLSFCQISLSSCPVHEDKNVDYKMEILKTFKNNPLARQVFESIQIVNSKLEDDYQLNSKKEFNQAMIVTAKYSKGLYERNSNEK